MNSCGGQACQPSLHGGLVGSSPMLGAMVELNSITTKQGDDGQSRLADGGALPKEHAVFHAMGTIDECNCQLGIVLLQDLPDLLGERLRQVQNDLFDCGSDLATPPDVSWEEKATRIDAGYVDRLEAWTKEAGQDLQALKSFILPGGSVASAHLHLARSMARRAERQAWAAWRDLPGRSGQQPHVVRYLNRLSDLLFQYARLCNDQGKADVLWVPGGGAG